MAIAMDSVAILGLVEETIGDFRLSSFAHHSLTTQVFFLLNLLDTASRRESSPKDHCFTVDEPEAESHLHRDREGEGIPLPFRRPIFQSVSTQVVGLTLQLPLVPGSVVMVVMVVSLGS